jgi:hypothetical protein
MQNDVRCDGVAPRAGEEALQPPDVVGQVTLVHEVALSQILPNLLEVNGLKCTHTAIS